MKHHHRLYSSIIFLLLLIIAFVWVSRLPGLSQFADPDYVRSYILGWGHFGYLAYMLILIISIPLPLPSNVIVFAGGYLYGTILGTVLSLIATVIGSIAAFYLVRWLGEPILEKLVDKHHLQHFNHIFKKKGTTAALISYALPIFPSDEVSLILGLTNTKFIHFLFLVTVGNIPRCLITAGLGHDLYAGVFGIKTFILLVLGALFIIITIFREKFKFIFFKELHALEKDVKEVEEYVEEVEGKKSSKKRKKKCL